MSWWKPPAYLVLVLLIGEPTFMDGFEFVFGAVEAPFSAGEFAIVVASVALSAVLVHWAWVR